MPMEQAKWYRILFSSCVFYGYRNPYYRRSRNMSARFHQKVFIYQLREELYFKKISTKYQFQCDVFIGKKKLNKLIEEAHLLGLEDELLIFERR